LVQHLALCHQPVPRIDLSFPDMLGVCAGRHRPRRADTCADTPGAKTEVRAAPAGTLLASAGVGGPHVFSLALAGSGRSPGGARHLGARRALDARAKGRVPTSAHGGHVTRSRHARATSGHAPQVHSSLRSAGPARHRRNAA
jgi:hypothetical protein